MHFWFKDYIELVEFSGVKYSINDIKYSLEAFVRTFDFVFINIPHLPCIFSEIVR